MRRRILTLTGLFSVAAMLGCANDPASQGPLYRGTAQEQQRRAQRFDPYPTPDMESPMSQTMAGTRPPGYEQPRPEPTRAQWEQWNPPTGN